MNNDDLIEFLILEGGVEAAGLDSETGEMLYAFTDKIKDIAPEIYDKATESFNKTIMDFWVAGFVEISLEQDSPIVRLTEKALDEEEVSKLSRDQRITLTGIIEALRI
jgi:hypothetical protein